MQRVSSRQGKPALAPEVSDDPPLMPLPRKNSNRDAQQSILKSLTGDFPKPRTSIAYGLTAMIVAVVMLVLPLIYLALIGLVGWGTYWHAMNNWYWVTQVRGRAAIFAGLFYVGIIAIGALWVLSMLKPFFRNLGRSEKAEGLSRAKEPVLFSFADRIAEMVGSPRPDVIQFSPDVNASASFHAGFLGLFRKQFQLTIGVPLIAGLTTSQLAGVIAHEFGHFSQARGTLLSRLIYRVNSWFVQAIYERDTIDDVIDEMTNTEFGIVQIFGFLAWCVLNMGRGVLWCLMWVGMAFSSSLSRQMEYDADQYECGLVGSEIFGQTSQRFLELTIANVLASEFVMTSQNGNHLPRNYPEFVAGLADQFKKVKKKARKIVAEEKRSWLASHPVTRDRIAAAERLGYPGVFHSTIPARRLMKNFQQDAENWTLYLYVLRHGENFSVETLRPTSDALENYLTVMGARPAAD